MYVRHAIACNAIMASLQNIVVSRRPINPLPLDLPYGVRLELTTVKVRYSEANVLGWL